MLSILLKSGLNKKAMPLPAPGNRQEATTMTSNNINKVGMSVLLNFSMPFLTPRMTTKCVSTMKATVHSNGFTGSEEKFLK